MSRPTAPECTFVLNCLVVWSSLAPAMSPRSRGGEGGGGLFTIHIAEEDRPRRWRAHRHCTNGRAVSPITCWVALVPKAECNKAEWAGG